jgi:hypothetical protein
VQDVAVESMTDNSAVVLVVAKSDTSTLTSRCGHRSSGDSVSISIGTGIG